MSRTRRTSDDAKRLGKRTGPGRAAWITTPPLTGWFSMPSQETAGPKLFGDAPAGMVKGADLTGPASLNPEEPLIARRHVRPKGLSAPSRGMQPQGAAIFPQLMAFPFFHPLAAMTLRAYVPRGGDPSDIANRSSTPQRGALFRLTEAPSCVRLMLWAAGDSSSNLMRTCPVFMQRTPSQGARHGHIGPGDPVSAVGRRLRFGRRHHPQRPGLLVQD